MHPLRRYRLTMVIFIVVMTSIAVGLMSFALRKNINLFYTPSSVVLGEAPINVNIRVGGMVVEGSLIRAEDSLLSIFKVTDGVSEVKVQHEGILPDMFAEGGGAVATGKLDENFIFIASTVLAKHDENYMPPEVTFAMDEARLHTKKLNSEAGSLNNN
ncbi:MAG: cytochrome c maturation protein CcmE [Porticoccus sp.]|jgi:cytochrome c-type biogenesis protein CcmE|uniref:cytochrome c maturation protein CcmE n=1 Tax=Porticoccus sp. Uisw_050_02 TaxID=3230978 RepID=UPI001D7BC2A6|nr:cytochrome c maturation protein CcmE [Porticoccus sp.]